MRILHVITSLIKGGAERLTLDIGHQLIAQGHDFKLITLNSENHYPTLSQGIDIEVCPSTVSYSITGKDTIKIDAFKKAVETYQPDIIHSHLLEADIVSQQAYIEAAKYVTHWHGCYKTTNPTPFSKRFSKTYIGNQYTLNKLKANYKRSDNQFIAISQFIHDYVHENVGISEKKITILHNAIDLERFAFTNSRRFDDTIRLVNIGSMMPNKNQAFLLDVVVALKAKGHKVLLDLIGSGPTENLLKEKAKQLGIEYEVNFTGAIPNPEKYLNEAHIYAHCAWHEPFGLVLIEAMSCGLPVVSFNTGGPIEIVQEGKTGYLVEKDNLATFVDKILQLAGDRALYEDFSKNAMAASKQYDIKTYTDKLIAFYQQILA